MVRITVPLIDAAQSRDKTKVPLCVPQWFLPHLISYAETLSEIEYFIGTDEQKLAAMYDGEDALLALMFPEDCQDQVEIPYNSCGDVFMPDSPFISWAPNDPVASPDYKPFGYKNPPWVRPADAIAGTQLIGIEETDVITTMLQVAGGYDFALQVTTFIYGILFAGLPRFTVHVSGAGTVELHLLKVPFGGRAFINADYSLTNNKFVDLTTFGFADLGSYIAQIGALVGIFGGTLFVEEIVEIHLEEPGDHEIHVMMLPTVSADTFIGFGGGLRSVNFCGDVRGVDSFMPEFQIQGVDLIWRPNISSNWINLGRVVGQDGEPGQQGIPGVCEPCADQIGILPPVSPNYYYRATRVLVEGVFADMMHSFLNAGVDGVFAYTANSLESGLPSSLRHNPSLTLKTGNALEVDADAKTWLSGLYINEPARVLVVAYAACELLPILQNWGSEPFPFDKYVAAKSFSTYVQEAWTISELQIQVDFAPTYLLAQSLLQQLMVYAYTYPTTFIQAVNWEANLSAVTAIESFLCEDQYSHWCRFYDFEEELWAWVSMSGTTYTEDVGFEDGLYTLNGSTQNRSATIRQLLSGESLITRIAVTYDIEPSDTEGLLVYAVYNNGLLIGTDDAIVDIPATFVFEDINLTGNEIIIRLDAGSAVGVDPGGSATIKSVQTHGEGVAPAHGVACGVATWEIFSGGVNGEGLFYPVVLTEWDAVNLNWVSTTPGTSTHEVTVGLDIPSGSVLTELEFTHQTYTSIDRATAYRKEGSANQQVWHYTEDTEDTHLVYPVGFDGPCTLWILVDGQGATKSRLLSVRAKGTGISPE
jgi:hypothetical protein